MKILTAAEVEELVKAAWMDGLESGQRLPHGVTADHVADAYAKYVAAVKGAAHG
jgi:hypothetical protein